VYIKQWCLCQRWIILRRNNCRHLIWYSKPEGNSTPSRPPFPVSLRAHGPSSFSRHWSRDCSIRCGCSFTQENKVVPYSPYRSAANISLFVRLSVCRRVSLLLLLLLLLFLLLLLLFSHSYCSLYYLMRFKVITAIIIVFILILGFWRRVHMLVDARRFGETYYLYLPALNMETVCFSETSASTNISTRRQNPKIKKNRFIFSCLHFVQMQK
jgi:hypothetical protein